MAEPVELRQFRGQALDIVLSWNFLPELNDAQPRRTFAELTSQQFDAGMVDASGSLWPACPNPWGQTAATERR
ncbi:hypothetical protein [Bradyrhizobium yuanmingense]|uniref:hypothetical protein n=1 Tax=Bradyrhizobium yuanmingense TaxID=108015 RepID=UPI0023B8C3E6|nr:hypothetical protein [Bradyrhizobium yuanmingense]MDF0582210.1 hypothetical protein [Bradyrhizobium yuanmingense]